MTNLFLLQLLLTYCVGSVWIFLIIKASKHFGSKIGGFIGGLPSTALVSFFFIGITQSKEIAAEAATVFPLAYGVTGLFLVAYALFIKRGLVFSLFYSLLIWFGFSLFIAILNPMSLAVNLIVYLIILSFSIYVLEVKLKVVSKENPGMNYSFKQTAGLSLTCGLIIMSAVFFAKLAGPVFGGIFAAFPAIFISTLVMSYKLFGADFSRAMTKPLLITGMITIVIYVLSVKFFYLRTGLYFGTLISIFISAGSAYFTYLFIRCKIK